MPLSESKARKYSKEPPYGPGPYGSAVTPLYVQPMYNTIPRYRCLRSSVVGNVVDCDK